VGEKRKPSCEFGSEMSAEILGDLTCEEERVKEGFPDKHKKTQKTKPTPTTTQKMTALT